MFRRWDDPKNPPWDGAASWDEDVVEPGNKRKISDHPGDTDWMCGPVNGVSVYILQLNRVNPDTEAEWKYADSSTKSSATLKAIRRGRFGCAWPPRAPTTSRAHRAIRRRIWCAERAVS